MSELTEDWWAPDAPSDDPGAFDIEVSREAWKLRVRDAAREKVASEKAAEVEMPSFDIGLLSDILSRPLEPPHRIEGLIPSDAGTLIVAQRKTGKTTLELNLAHSLITGEPFLGRFATRPIDGRVAVMNFEVSGAQFGRWADEAGVDPDRLLVVNLRGRRNPLGVEEDKKALADLMRAHEIESIIVDPFGRAYVGKSQNDAGEVGAWLADLDRWARADVGAVDLVLTAHAGWDGERTRGASALEDWADSIINLTRSQDDESVRFFRAMGRDVEVDEDQLTFDPHTRQLSLTGFGSRRQANANRKASELASAVVEVVTESPEINGTQVGEKLKEAGVSFQRGAERKALANAVAGGFLTVVDGARNKKIYSPKGQLPRPAPSYPEGVAPNYPNPSLIGGVVREGSSPDQLPRNDREAS